MLSENLRLLRKNFKLTQQEVADIIGTDRSTYTFYETGKTRPSLENIKKLSDIYNVTMGSICGYEKNHPESKIDATEATNISITESVSDISKNEKFIILAYRSLSPRQKAEFVDSFKTYLKG